MPEEKLNNLISILKEMKSVLLAYSGGVDSTFLLKALRLSGIEKCMAVTSSSETTPEDDLKDAVSIAMETGIMHRVIKTRELQNEEFLKNTPKRCFYCKDELFKTLHDIADKEGLAFVIDGSNMDDAEDLRPGREAGEKWGVRSPLMEAGFTKAEIREESRKMGLSTWNKPSSPCLASRFPYGLRITADALKQVASAERFLKNIGFNELRVRHYGDTARIELRKADIDRMLKPEIRDAVVKELKSLGYKFVALDLEEHKTGKMNAGLA